MMLNSNSNRRDHRLENVLQLSTKFFDKPTLKTLVSLSRNLGFLKYCMWRRKHFKSFSELKEFCSFIDASNTQVFKSIQKLYLNFFCDNFDPTLLKRFDLGQFTNLTKLSLNTSLLRKDFMSSIMLTKIHSLKISGEELTDAEVKKGVVELISSLKLKKLALKVENFIDEYFLDLIAECTSLNNLEKFTFFKVKPALALDVLIFKLTSLKHLIVVECDLDKIIANLNCSEIHKIKITNIELGASFFEYIQKCQKLEILKISLDHKELVPTHSHGFVTNNSLTSLCLKGSSKLLGNDFLKAFASCSKLTKLEVKQNDFITDEIHINLKKFENLKHVSFVECKLIGNKIFDFIASGSSECLKSLVFVNNYNINLKEIDCNGIIRNCKKLTKFYVNNNILQKSEIINYGYFDIKSLRSQKCTKDEMRVYPVPALKENTYALPTSSLDLTDSIISLMISGKLNHIMNHRRNKLKTNKLEFEDLPENPYEVNKPQNISNVSETNLEIANQKEINEVLPEVAHKPINFNKDTNSENIIKTGDTLIKTNKPSTEFSWDTPSDNNSLLEQSSAKTEDFIGSKSPQEKSANFRSENKHADSFSSTETLKSDDDVLTDRLNINTMPNFNWSMKSLNEMFEKEARIKTSKKGGKHNEPLTETMYWESEEESNKNEEISKAWLGLDEIAEKENLNNITNLNSQKLIEKLDWKKFSDWMNYESRKELEKEAKTQIVIKCKLEDFE